MAYSKSCDDQRSTYIRAWKSIKSEERAIVNITVEYIKNMCISVSVIIIIINVVSVAFVCFIP